LERAKGLFRAWGAQGGKTRAKRLTAQERSAAARKAVQVRWKRLSPAQRAVLARKAALARWKNRPSQKGAGRRIKAVKRRASTPSAGTSPSTPRGCVRSPGFDVSPQAIRGRAVRANASLASPAI